MKKRRFLISFEYVTKHDLSDVKIFKVFKTWIKLELGKRCVNFKVVEEIKKEK